MRSLAPLTACVRSFFYQDRSMDKHIEIQLNHLASKIDDLSDKIQMLLTIIQESYADDTEDSEDIIRDLDGNTIGQDRDSTQEL
jgi:hypothetical protein